LAIVDRSTLDNVDWEILHPNKHGDWIEQRGEELSTFVPLESDPKAGTTGILRIYGPGIRTNRDKWAFSFSSYSFASNVESSILNFNSMLGDVPLKDDKKIKWSSKFDSLHNRNVRLVFDPTRIIIGAYRPFQKMHLYSGANYLDR